jgi:tyrosine-protein kinase Etk/Wzc
MGVQLNQPNAESQTSRVVSTINILVHWRRFIEASVLIVVLLATLISFLLPRYFKAKATLLPPKEKDVLSSLGAASSMLRGLGGGSSAIRALSGNSNGYNFFAILNSRTALELIVRQYDLMSVYEISDSSMESAVKELSRNITFEEGVNDDITIEVIDKDPYRAANIANDFIDVLNDLSIRLGTQEARSNREFIERQITAEQQLLRSAEDSLQRFQEQTGLLITPDQANSLAPIVELYAAKAKKEIELAVLRRVVANEVEIRQKEIEIAELNKKLISFPNIGVRSVRLYRDVIIHQKILEFLIPVLQQAKVDEQKDVPVLLVLDRAIVPEKKFRPQRTLIVFLSASLTLVFSSLLSLVFHRWVQFAGTEGSFQKAAKRIASRTSKMFRVS